MGIIDNLGLVRKEELTKLQEANDLYLQKMENSKNEEISNLKLGLDSTLSRVNELQKALDSTFTTPVGNTQDKILDLFQYYRSKYENYNFATMSKGTPIVRGIQNEIVLQVSKNGFNIRSKFAKKCPKCGFETTSDATTCEVCGNTELVKPKMSEYTKLNKFLKDCNHNNKGLKYEIDNFTLDATRYDEAILQLSYNFFLENGLMIYELDSVQRVIPVNIHANVSQFGKLGVNMNGVAEGFCPLHRDKGVVELGKRKYCEHCQKQYRINNPLWSADYYLDFGDKVKTRTYYNRREIIPLGMFEKSSRYSPMLTLGNKITSILAIDQLINDIYVLRKVPNRALFFKTNDIESIKKSDEYNRLQLLNNSNFVAKYAIGSEAEGEFVKVIDMLGSIDELKLMDLQDKYEKDIAQFYHSVINPQTRRIEVDEDFISNFQKQINDILEFMLKRYDINDWVLELKPNELSAEANALRMDGLKIQNAMGKLNLGFEIVSYDTENRDFVFKDIPTQQPMLGNFSSFSSNSRGLENTFGNLEGTEELTKDPK